MRLVILPQAIKVVLPAMGNQFVYVLKMSSLVSIIGIGDLTRKANELVTTTYRPLEIELIPALKISAWNALSLMVKAIIPDTNGEKLTPIIIGRP